MKLMIDIPEEIYKASQIIDVKYEDLVQIPLEVIAKGIVLPEKHGRLIDADELWDAYHDLDYDFYEAFDRVPTILKATGVEE